MAGASAPGGSVTYAYNGLGLRARKSGAAVNSGAANYVYDEAGQLLEEYDANGIPVYETIYLNTTPVGAIKQTGTAGLSSLAVTLYNVYADHLDTPRLITKQDQTIVWRWDTAEAFGATGPDQNPSGVGTFTFNPRFPGQVFDSETGLNQNWNREYDARTGRYIQSDPIGLRGGINIFSYVSGNPLAYIDPLGLCGLDPGSCMSFPNNPLKRNPNYHEYETFMTICRQSPTCSEAVFSRLREFPTPAVPKKGGVNTCDITDIAEQKVSHVVDEANFALFNITMPGHMFDPGYIYRNVFVDANGNVVIRSYGEGTGDFKTFNEFFGKYGWPLVDSRIQKPFR